MASQIAQRLAGAQAQRGTPAAVTGTPPGLGMVGNAVSRQLSELRGADPRIAQKHIQDMISKASALINDYAIRAPGISLSLAKALSALQKALKEAHQAAQTVSAMGGEINLAAAGPPGLAQGASAGPGAGIRQAAGPIAP